MCFCMKHQTGMVWLLIMFVSIFVFVSFHASCETVVGDPEERTNAGQTECGGRAYRPRRRISTVLLIGTDKNMDEKQDTSIGAYRNAGQADFLLLCVIDDNAKQITPLIINRDTMTDITTLSSFGKEMGLWNAQICLSYGFGDGKELSCKLTCRAVSSYMSDIEVKDYLAVNLDGINVFNDAIGGVTVTLSEDFSAYDASMVAGTTITLHGDQAEYYTRMRYHVGDQSNASRIIRQIDYIRNAGEVLRERIVCDTAGVENIYEAMQPYILTNMPKGRLINYANLVTQYEVRPVVEIDGTNVVGTSGYVEFYPDADSLQQALLNLFYEPVAEAE